jgi:hypothetical protein
MGTTFFFCTLVVGWLLRMLSLLAAASPPPGEGRTSWATESQSRGVSSIRKAHRILFLATAAWATASPFPLLHGGWLPSLPRLHSA